MPAMPVTYLSRSALMSLLFDKLSTIRDEADEMINPDASDPRDLPQAKQRLKRIALEARRAAALIETNEIAAKSGHCLHCGKTYEEHLDERPKRTEGELVRAKKDSDLRCIALKNFFESMEIETYQGIIVVEASGT